ncbi:MAG: hypothetical protein R3F39_03685 [Myxococcota bacterium]
MRSRWLRDLAVYRRFYEKLLAALNDAVDHGIHVPEAYRDDADVSLAAWLAWCAATPALAAPGVEGVAGRRASLRRPR